MKNTAFLIALTVFVFFSCKKKEEPIITNPTPTTTSGGSLGYTDINNTLGFGVLSKLIGIWDGPVNSTTALGSYPKWIVDFRPISENQISAKNELDTLNDIHLSFFIAKYNNEYRVAFRNGGKFNASIRVSYFLCDSVSENSSGNFYRFSEVVKGKNRAYTTVFFKSNSLILKSYTNAYNTLLAPTLHMSWLSKLQDVTSASASTMLFSFPQKTLTKDFTNSFTSVTEAVYYNTTNEPYPENMQPYLGKTTINYTFDASHTPTSTKKVMLVITTQPLFSGVTYNPSNLKYISGYVNLTASDLNFTFNYMHPGTYYVYAFYDNDMNNTINSGDWMSLSNATFTLAALGNTVGNTQIDFTLP